LEVNMYVLVKPLSLRENFMWVSQESVRTRENFLRENVKEIIQR